MKSMKMWLLVALLVLAGMTAEAATGKVLKVLPHFLDLEGRHTLSPSLYERDAYQAKLRKKPAEVSTVRFDVNWKASSVDRENTRVKVEIRGEVGGPLVVLEEKVKPGHWFSSWTKLEIPKEQYQTMKEVVAWRVTIWSGGEQVAEKKSFLW